MESQSSNPAAQPPETTAEPPAAEPEGESASPTPDNDRGQRKTDVAANGEDSASYQFVVTRSGGLIRLTVDDPDNAEAAGRAQIDLREAAAQYARGEFSGEPATHGLTPPGTPQMRQLRNRIIYTEHAIQDGAELIISSTDARAVTAIHQFLEFQIREHQSGDWTAIRP